MRNKSGEYRLTDDRIRALVQGMRRCRISATELSQAVNTALGQYEMARVIKVLRNPGTALNREHWKRTAATARKLEALLLNRRAGRLRNRWPHLEHELRELNLELSAAASNVTPAREEPIVMLLRKFVAIYERATGDPAKLPWSDCITGEARGPLLKFLTIAAGDVFRDEGIRLDAIKHRLRAFMSTGERIKLLRCSRSPDWALLKAKSANWRNGRPQAAPRPKPPK